MLWYYVLVQKEACMSIFTLRVDEYYFLFRPCSKRESACQRERDRKRERVRDRERERERRGKMSVLFTCLCPYSMYCVYMYISCTPYQTIIREEGRERDTVYTCRWSSFAPVLSCDYTRHTAADADGLQLLNQTCRGSAFLSDGWMVDSGLDGDQVAVLLVPPLGSLPPSGAASPAQSGTGSGSNAYCCRETSGRECKR